MKFDETVEHICEQKSYVCLPFAAALYAGSTECPGAQQDSSLVQCEPVMEAASVVFVEWKVK